MPPRRAKRRKPATRTERKIILALLGLFLISAALFHWRRTTQSPACPPECPHGREALSAAIAEASHRHGLSPDLVAALVWKESRFRSCARGDHGEYGLMQITDAAVEDWSKATRHGVPTTKELLSPDINLEIGCWFLARALSRWKGYASQEPLALAEYNAGRSTVLKLWKPDSPDTAVTPEQITYPGTREYVRQILHQRDVYRAGHPQKPKQQNAGQEKSLNPQPQAPSPETKTTPAPEPRLSPGVNPAHVPETTSEPVPESAPEPEPSFPAPDSAPEPSGEPSGTR